MEPNTETVAYEFTPAEFERLAAFRQAVLAGFYTDHLHDDDEADWPFDPGAGPQAPCPRVTRRAG
jgi:hypothetical protein